MEKQPTHKEQMECLKEYDPITYYELHSNPTGVDGDDDLGTTLFSIIVIGAIIWGCIHFFAQ
jgi:hypothetical protein